MAWFILLIAGALEVVWASALKQIDGLSRPIPILVAIIGMIASVALLALAMRTLPLGTAYTVWTGIGAVGAFVVGIVVYGDSVSSGRIAAAALITGGIILMRLTSSE